MNSLLPGLDYLPLLDVIADGDVLLRELDDENEIPTIGIGLETLIQHSAGVADPEMEPASMLSSFLEARAEHIRLRA